ncbi:MAG: pantetheine-phosphate adenylyltransferase [Erysipelotrichaceae bacterium]|nr:pantetheine-phosphate adenylyltransferase [Erysipelotrichaceae bacterium]
MKIAVYPGSFDPITNGHLDIIRRSVKLFDKVYILVAANSSKKSFFSLEDRVTMIKEATKDFVKINVDSFEGLTVNFAKSVGATHIIRGLRAVSDYEYEFRLFATNSFVDHSVDTIFFMSDEKNTNISSSYILELHRNKVDVSSLVPAVVSKKLKEIK